MMEDEAVLTLLSQNLEPLTLVYRYFAVSDAEDKKPTMCFNEFHDLCAAAGLAPPRRRKGHLSSHIEDIDQLSQFEVDHILETNTQQKVLSNLFTSEHVNILTEQEVRLAFSQSQQVNQMLTDANSLLTPCQLGCGTERRGNERTVFYGIHRVSRQIGA